MEARTAEGRSVVASGKTVEDAIGSGLTMLGARREQVDVEVISVGSRGVFGFGAEDARVRLTFKSPLAPSPAEPDTVGLVAAAAAPSRPEGVRGERAPTLPPKAVSGAAEGPAGPKAEAESEVRQAVDQVVRDVLAEILAMMGIRASIEVQTGNGLADEGESPALVLNLTGEDLGILIGRRGETLRALQYLVRLMVSHRTKHWANLVIDVENYRVRRQHALESLAKRVAEDVARSGRSQALEPMPPDERRLVHIALRSHPRVMTQSIGEGERRKVTIIPRH